MKDKAVRFLREVVKDPDRADEIEEMSPEEYALHKRIQIKNLSSARFSKRGALNMPSRQLTRAELESRIEELETENEMLNDKLDSILDIASEDEDEDDDDEDEDDGDSGD